MAQTHKTMNVLSRFLFILGLVCFVLSIGGAAQPAAASPSATWAPDEKVPGYLDDTYTPILLADRNRTVHAFASQWVYAGDGRKLAIVYRQWTLKGGWTRPVDIILSPIGGSANLLGAFLDSSDTMHVIFTATENISRRTFVFYSHAPASLADLALAWSPPILVGDGALGLNSGAIAGDEQGNLVIIYSGNRDGSGVYYVHSKDAGKNWSEPEPLFLTFNSDLSAFSLRLAAGPNQKIRAAWNVVTNLGVDESLYFASFDAQTAAWSSPLELDERINLPDYFGPSFPVITDNGREIVVFYNGGNPVPGRPVGPGRPIQRSRISLDGGATWSEPLDPFPFHVGRSGEHAMVLDGNGIPHVLFVQRIEGQDERGNYSIIGGIWHSTFENNAWSNPDRFVTTLSPHDVHAVVVQGNVLLAVWRQDPGEGANGIWFSYNILDAPELPVTPLATAVLETTVQITPTLSPQSDAFVPTPLPAFLQQPPPSDLGRNPALPIIAAIVPVALILVGVIVGYRFLNSRR
jgi:hypothetical protein